MSSLRHGLLRLADVEPQVGYRVKQQQRPVMNWRITAECTFIAPSKTGVNIRARTEEDTYQKHD